jgi:hypothetical protein
LQEARAVARLNDLSFEPVELLDQFLGRQSDAHIDDRSMLCSNRWDERAQNDELPVQTHAHAPDAADDLPVEAHLIGEDSLL